jgi:hypothetical protein
MTEQMKAWESRQGAGQGKAGGEGKTRQEGKAQKDRQGTQGKAGIRAGKELTQGRDLRGLSVKGPYSVKQFVSLPHRWAQQLTLLLILGIALTLSPLFVLSSKIKELKATLAVTDCIFDK